jgi:chromosome segregation ATPase
MIEGNGFEQLEQRIGQAIGRIQELTRERDALRAEREKIESQKFELQTQMDKLQSDQLELESQLEAVRTASIARTEYEDRKREIERRVENLLERFGELDEPDAS